MTRLLILYYGDNLLPIALSMRTAHTNTSCCETWELWMLNLVVHLQIMQTASPPPRPTPIQWVTGVLSPRVQRPRREADHLPPLSTEVKNNWSFPSAPPYAFAVSTVLPLRMVDVLQMFDSLTNKWLDDWRAPDYLTKISDNLAE
jgi:hypothetical protein